MTGAPQCRECGAPITRSSRTGFCRKHYARWLSCDPERKALMRATARKNFQTPKAKEARLRASRTSGAWKAAMAAVTPEHRKLAGARARATKLAWCPSELRDEYVRLIRSSRIKAAEARVIILAQHEADMARFRNRITPAQEAAAAKPDDAPVSYFPAKARNQTKCPPPPAVVEAVARDFGFSLVQVLGNGRKTDLVRCRQTLYAVLRANGHSYERIGNWTNRDHSTVIYGCEMFPTYARLEPKMAQVFHAYTTTRDDARESEAA